MHHLRFGGLESLQCRGRGDSDMSPFCGQQIILTVPVLHLGIGPVEVLQGVLGGGVPVHIYISHA